MKRTMLKEKERKTKRKKIGREKLGKRKSISTLVSLSYGVLDLLIKLLL